MRTFRVELEHAERMTSNDDFLHDDSVAVDIALLAAGARLPQVLRSRPQQVCRHEENTVLDEARVCVKLGD